MKVGPHKVHWRTRVVDWEPQCPFEYMIAGVGAKRAKLQLPCLIYMYATVP